MLVNKTTNNNLLRRKGLQENLGCWSYLLLKKKKAMKSGSCAQHLDTVLALCVCVAIWKNSSSKGSNAWGLPGGGGQGENVEATNWSTQKDGEDWLGFETTRLKHLALTRRIFLTIKSFLIWWSIPLFSCSLYLIQGRYSKQKLEASHS